MKNLVLILFLFNGLCSQAQQIDPRLADDLFKVGNFIDAIPEYKKQLKLDRNNEEVLTKLAQCYLNTNIDKAEAVKYLEKAKALEKHDKEVEYYLAVAYTHQNNYKKAIETLVEYKSNPGKHEEEIPLLMKSFQKALQLKQSPINVEFENMGDKINSEYPDYSPFITEDEKTIVFTSRRKEGKGTREFDGYYPSDIFITTFDGVNFTIARNAGSLNSAADEECVGIYDDGSAIFVYIDNFMTGQVGDIFTAQKKGNTYGKKKLIEDGVNSKEMETSASISSDENTLFFASNRNDGKGGLDIYMTRKLPNGKWAQSQNLEVLNTTGNEDYPVLSQDGQTLYFCSNGIPGMGGYDLFKSTWNPDDNTWSEPINLGFPLNTSYDEKVISFADDEKHAYISAVRPEGFGDFDIYRVTFNEVVIKPTLYIVDIKDATSTETVKNGHIYIYDQYDNEVGNYAANPNSNEFTIILNPGKYSFEIEAPGYEAVTKDFVVSEFDADNGMNKKTFKIAK